MCGMYEVEYMALDGLQVVFLFGFRRLCDCKPSVKEREPNRLRYGPRHERLLGLTG